MPFSSWRKYQLAQSIRHAPPCLKLRQEATTTISLTCWQEQDRPHIEVPSSKDLRYSRFSLIQTIEAIAGRGGHPIPVQRTGQIEKLRTNAEDTLGALTSCYNSGMQIPFCTRLAAQASQMNVLNLSWSHGVWSIGVTLICR